MDRMATLLVLTMVMVPSVAAEPPPEPLSAEPYGTYDWLLEGRTKRGQELSASLQEPTVSRRFSSGDTLWKYWDNNRGNMNYPYGEFCEEGGFLWTSSVLNHKDCDSGWFQSIPVGTYLRLPAPMDWETSLRWESCDLVTLKAEEVAQKAFLALRVTEGLAEEALVCQLDLADERGLSQSLFEVAVERSISAANARVAAAFFLLLALIGWGWVLRLRWKLRRQG